MDSFYFDATPSHLVSQRVGHSDPSGLLDNDASISKAGPIQDLSFKWPEAEPLTMSEKGFPTTDPEIQQRAREYARRMWARFHFSHWEDLDYTESWTIDPFASGYVDVHAKSELEDTDTEREYIANQEERNRKRVEEERWFDEVVGRLSEEDNEAPTSDSEGDGDFVIVDLNAENAEADHEDGGSRNT